MKLCLTFLMVSLLLMAHEMEGRTFGLFENSETPVERTKREDKDSENAKDTEEGWNRFIRAAKPDGEAAATGEPEKGGDKKDDKSSAPKTNQMSILALGTAYLVASRI